MRITQNMMTRNYMRDMNTNLERLAKSQSRMLGQKYSKASENMSDTSRALRVRQSLYDDNQYLTNIRDANGRLSSAESNMNNMNDILVTAREQLMKKSLNDANVGEREVIARQLDSMADEIVQFANSQFSDSYLFGGTENGKAPFAVGDDGRLTYNDIPVDDIYQDTDGVYYYTVNDDTDPMAVARVPENGKSYFDVGLGLTLTADQVDSKSAFQVTFSGLDILGCGKMENGTSGNLFNLLKDAANLLREDPFDRDAVEKVTTSMKTQTDSLMLNVTDLGSKTAFLEKTQERLEGDIYNLTALQQKLEVSDTATESMNWKMYSAVMMATYQFGSQVLPTSLMDFLK